MEVKNYSLKVGNTQLIENLNLTFSSGKMHHLLGSNGSGKSSFAKSCAGLLKYRGTITLEGKVILLGSSSNIPSMFSVKDVLAILSKRFSKTKIEELYNLLKLETIKPNLPIKKMSDGQKQKVKMLAFLSDNPEVIILDEFTNGLDKASTLDVYHFLNHYLQQNTVTNQYYP